MCWKPIPVSRNAPSLSPLYRFLSEDERGRESDRLPPPLSLSLSPRLRSDETAAAAQVWIDANGTRSGDEEEGVFHLILQEAHEEILPPQLLLPSARERQSLPAAAVDTDQH